jgi:mycothiol synthase
MEQLRMINKMGKVPPYKIEEGFEIRLFRPGQEQLWVDICRHGLLEENQGLECWKSAIVDMENLVPERDTFFVFDREGNAVATCTAFILEGNVALMHMLAAKPEARGHHLGAAMTAYSLNKLDKELPQGERMVRLKSDDWRLPAVKAYLQAGFQPVLFDVDMDTRWKAICEKLNLHGIEMLDDNGQPTGVIL